MSVSFGLPIADLLSLRPGRRAFEGDNAQDATAVPRAPGGFILIMKPPGARGTAVASCALSPSKARLPGRKLRRSAMGSPNDTLMDDDWDGERSQHDEDKRRERLERSLEA